MTITQLGRLPSATTALDPIKQEKTQPSGDMENSLETSEGPRQALLRPSSPYVSNDRVLAAERSGEYQKLEDAKVLTYWHGVCLIITRQIGVGIFSIPALINRNTGSVGLSLIVWVTDGIIAYTGALSYAELGCAIPRNGGAYVYLQHIYGPVVACLFSWTMIFILKPVGAAAVALMFGEYVVRVLLFSLKSVDKTPIWVNKIMALGCIWTAIAINIKGTRESSTVNTIFTIIKVTAVASIAIIGIAILAGGYDAGNLSHNWFDGSTRNSGEVALALFSGLWTFNGLLNTTKAYLQMNFVSAEMKNPSRDIPRAIHTALPLVIGLFLAANIGYYSSLPMEVLKSSQTISMDFGIRTIGALGGLFYALCVAASCFGVTNAVAFTVARLIYVAGTERHLPSIFGRLHLEARTPVAALLLHGSLSSMYLMIGTFGGLIVFNEMVECYWFFATVCGLLVLRVRQPDLHRPYKVFVVMPVIFCCALLSFIGIGLYTSPLDASFAIIFIIACIPVYYLLVVGWRTFPGLENFSFPPLESQMWVTLPTEA